jgi:hypothetical protein
MNKNITIIILVVSNIIFISAWFTQANIGNKGKSLDRSLVISFINNAMVMKTIVTPGLDESRLKLAKSYIMMSYSKISEYLDQHESELRDLSFEITNARLSDHDENMLKLNDDERARSKQFRIIADRDEKYVKVIK